MARKPLVPKTIIMWRAFGDDVVYTRRKRELGVRGAASATGISPATFSRIENGNRCFAEHYLQICAWMGRDPSRYIRQVF